jgi:hypothetical protein
MKQYSATWHEMKMTWGARIALYNPSSSFMERNGVPREITAKLRDWFYRGEEPSGPVILTKPLNLDPNRRFLSSLRAAYGCNPSEFVALRESPDWTQRSWAEVRAAIQGADPLGTPLAPSENITPCSHSEFPTEEELEVTENGDTAELVSTGYTLRTLEELLEATKVDLSKWVVDSYTVNKWDAQTKEAVVPMFQVKARLVRLPPALTGPSSPVSLRKIEVSHARKLALIVPDSQHGYRRTDSGELVPMHDQAACDLVVQAALWYQPSDIVLLGDMLDLAPFGSYTKGSDVWFTTQPSIDALHQFLVRLRRACPSASIVYIEGNHEYRILRSIRDRLPELETVKAPGSDLPLVSVENMLGLRDLDIDYYGPYGETYWLWSQIQVHHGRKTGPRGGLSVSKNLDNAHYSNIFGHVHRVEVATRTVHGPDGIKYISAMTPGSLCRNDGAVPGVTSHPDWQQGFGLVSLVDGLEHFSVVHIKETPDGMKVASCGDVVFTQTKED